MDKEQFWDALSKPTDYRKSCRWCKYYIDKHDRIIITNHRTSARGCTNTAFDHPGYGCVLQGHKHFEYDNSRT